MPAAKRHTAKRHVVHRRKATVHQPSLLTKGLKRLYYKSKKADKSRTAKRPGRRVSASGKRYYEARPNRSDRSTRTRL
jgi:hypothetical protein